MYLQEAFPSKRARSASLPCSGRKKGVACLSQHGGGMGEALWPIDLLAGGGPGVPAELSCGQTARAQRLGQIT